MRRRAGRSPPSACSAAASVATSFSRPGPSRRTTIRSTWWPGSARRWTEPAGPERTSSEPAPRGDGLARVFLFPLKIRASSRGSRVFLARDVARAVRVDLDAGAHRRGDGDLLDVAALGARRLEPQHL